MNIFTYEEYKQYLRDWIEHRPKKGRGEINAMATHLDINSSLLSAILNTERNLTTEQAFDLNNYLGHGELESDYFMALVSIERAGTYKLKDYYLKKKQNILKKSEKIKSRIKFENPITEEERIIYYSQSLYSIVRILSTLDKGITLVELIGLTKKKQEQLLEVIKNLIEFGLITERDGHYFATNKNIHISKESPHYTYHRSNWLLEQLQHSPNTSKEDLNFTCPCTLSRSDFDKIKKILLDSISKTHKIIDASPAEGMACLTIDFISYLDKKN